MPEAVRLRLASFRNCCSSSPVHSFLGLLAKTAWVWMILFLISCLPRVTSCFSLRPCFAMSSPNVATFKQLSSFRQPLSAVGKKLVPCTQQCSSKDREQEHLPKAGLWKLAIILGGKVCTRSWGEQAHGTMQYPACQAGLVSSIKQQANACWPVLNAHATRMPHDQLFWTCHS